MNKGITFDDKFVAKLKRGDEESFHRLYNHISPSMRLVCRRYVLNEPDAEDVFHEGFLKIYNGVRKLKNPDSFIGWMNRIFINTALDHCKKRIGEKTECVEAINELLLSETDTFESDSFNDGFDSLLTEDAILLIKKVDFSRDEMLDALKFIPEHFSAVFQLFVIDEFKHQEIAKLLSINEKTSKTRLLRARGLLKKELYKLAILKLSNG